MKRILPAVLPIIIITLVWVLAPSANAASKLESLYKFYDYLKGDNPVAGLTYDSAGNLYGTTKYGGGAGDIFELTPNSDGTWTESVIHTLSGLQGENPVAALTFDSAGNLYGTTQYGGKDHGAAGVVFELTPNRDGTWTDNVLYDFCSLSKCSDGSNPMSNVIFDQNGNLYGTTSLGGPSDGGLVYKLAPNGSGGWTESVIYSFTTGRDGGTPVAGVIFDKAGNLYGTTVENGLGWGTVFELSPNQDGGWSESTLYRFCHLENCRDGGQPFGALTLDAAGNLYGTTEDLGAYGYGNVFELTPTTKGPWNERVLHQFTGGDDGANPYGGVTFDSTGKLYGTTYSGGGSSSCNGGCGVVFKLVPGSNGVWHEDTIYAFNGFFKGGPEAGLVFNGSNFYGTTSRASNGHGFGSVFEVIP
jgi:uncharacterized repeat protein (TIGR03803 family)